MSLWVLAWRRVLSQRRRLAVCGQLTLGQMPMHSAYVVVAAASLVWLEVARYLQTAHWIARPA
jgi:hypothetical protein